MLELQISLHMSEITRISGPQAAYKDDKIKSFI